MDPDLDTEQRLLRDAIRGELQRLAPPAQLREWWDAHDFDAFVSKVAGLGWGGIGIPEELGGQGGGLIEQAVLFEELGRAAAPSSRILATSVTGALLGGIASLPDGARVVVDGSRPATVAVSADHPCDRPPGLRLDAGQRSLHGTVASVLDVTDAQVVIAVVDQDETRSVVAVDADAPGVESRPRYLIDRSRLLGDLELDGAAATTWGELRPGTMETVAARTAVLVAAESLGAARRMLEMTVDYVGQREQFGVPVGSFQAVKHAAAQAHVDIEATAAGVYYAAWAVEQGTATGHVAAWIAKVYAGETAARVADVGLKLHGAIAYTWEYDLQFLYKRAKVNQLLFGATATYRDRIADSLALVRSNNAGS